MKNVSPLLLLHIGYSVTVLQGWKASPRWSSSKCTVGIDDLSIQSIQHCLGGLSSELLLGPLETVSWCPASSQEKTSWTDVSWGDDEMWCCQLVVIKRKCDDDDDVFIIWLWNECWCYWWPVSGDGDKWTCEARLQVSQHTSKFCEDHNDST